MDGRPLYLAVDLGGSKTAVGVVDADGKLIHRTAEPTRLAEGPSGVFDHISRLCNPLLDAHPGIAAAGMTLPGPVVPERGLLLFAPYSGWADVPVARMLEQRIGMAVAIENDVNACALAERRFGSAKGVDTFLWVTVSAGIGGGVVANGRPVRGAHGMSGEIGHVIVEENGALCGCGNRGCLEAEAAGPAWARRARLLMSEGRATLLRERCSGDEGRIDARLIAKAARDGDELCLEVIDYAGRRIGRGLASFVNLLDPALVVVGGGVALSLDLLLPAIERELPLRTIGARYYRYPVIPSALGYDAALIGAATIAMPSR
ncbi:ROK family protein [Salinispira pacifica]